MRTVSGGVPGQSLPQGVLKRAGGVVVGDMGMGVSVIAIGRRSVRANAEKAEFSRTNLESSASSTEERPYASADHRLDF